MDSNISIKKLPFYWRLVHEDKHRGEIPQFLPFETNFDTQFNLLTQRRNKKILDALHDVYQEKWNIGNIQEINNLSNGYVADFTSFIEKYMSMIKLDIKTILEIGSGGCLILEHLHKKGYKVLGIDPSDYSQQEGKKRNVPVIVDFFPSSQITQKFDLIFHSDVIEHVDDPVSFLKTQYDQLNPEGILIISTPDCSENIEKGDISMFLHQHLSYFDRESLEKIVAVAGFSNIITEKATYGGSLNLFAQKKITHKKINVPNNSDSQSRKYQNFILNHQAIKKRFEEYLFSILTNKTTTLGIYAPVRSFPYIADMHVYDRIRFFDDASHWHGMYFDGIPVKVENFNDLQKNPVNNLIIMSPTFGDIMQKRIHEEFKNSIVTKKLKDFF